MELGRVRELRILTPSEYETVRQALNTNGPHPLADQTLKEAAGRRVRCEASDEPCTQPVTHWWKNDKKIIGCCAAHWRDNDPNDTLGLTDTHETATAPAKVAPTEDPRARPA